MSLTHAQHEVLRQAAEEGYLGNSLSGVKVVFTGTLSMPRVDLVKLLRAVGGYTEGSCRYGVEYLVVGDTKQFGMTHKIHDAKEYGITIIDEDEFVRLLLTNKK